MEEIIKVSPRYSIKVRRDERGVILNAEPLFSPPPDYLYVFPVSTNYLLVIMSVNGQRMTIPVKRGSSAHLINGRYV